MTAINGTLSNAKKIAGEWKTGEAQDINDPDNRTPHTAPTSLREFILEYLQGLADLQFQTIVTTRMLPTIYVLGIILSALAAISLTVSGFRESPGIGLTWALLLGPAVFLTLVTAWRIVLELCYGFFKLLLMLQDVTAVVDRISGQTDQIGDVVERVSTDMPRISFWRSTRKKESGGPDADVHKQEDDNAS